MTRCAAACWVCMHTVCNTWPQFDTPASLHQCKNLKDMWITDYSGLINMAFLLTSAILCCQNDGVIPGCLKWVRISLHFVIHLSTAILHRIETGQELFELCSVIRAH